MTVVDGRPAARAADPAPEQSVPGIGRLLALSPGGGVRVVSAPHGLDGRVRGVTIWDRSVPHAVSAGDLVLVPVPDLATPLAEHVLAVAAEARAAAVVVKDPLDLAAIRRRADHLGVTVLAVATDLAWDDVAVLARSLAPAERIAHAVRRPRTAGLAELAEAAACLLDGPVEITDAELRVLAFANLDHPVDELRAASIMAGRAPAGTRAWFFSSGLATRLRRGRAAVRVDVPAATAIRVIAPIVARDAVAGYVSLAAGRAPADESDLAVLTDVADAAAGQLVAGPAATVDEDVLAADLLRSALRGIGSVAALGNPPAGDGRWCLTALAVGPGGGGPVPATAEDDRLLASYARLLRRGSTAAVLDGRIYVLSPHAGAAGGRALAERMCRRAEVLYEAGMVACVSDPVGPDADLTAVRRAVDRAVDVLATQPRRGPALLSELRPATVLAQLRALARDEPSLLGGALDVLRDGSPRNADYLASLRAYFDAGGDVSEAAKRLHIHRNTLRYRLQRIEALCEVDLEDPAERFVVELHTRLIAFDTPHHAGA